MSIENIFDIAATGMSAQSVRMNTISSNLANAQSVTSNQDETYRAKYPVFSATFTDAMGGWDALDSQSSNGVAVVDIIQSEAPLQMRFEPHHPMADESGFVAYPNVNVVEEMANMMSASRSFQNNVDVLETAKQLVSRLITLGQR